MSILIQQSKKQKNFSQNKFVKVFRKLANNLLHVRLNKNQVTLLSYHFRKLSFYKLKLSAGF